MRETTRGFTLVELMITVAIIGILATIAIPSYRDYLARAKRADAQVGLVGLAQAMERFNANNGTYCGTAVAVAGGCASAGTAPCITGSPSGFARTVPTDGGTPYYNLCITAVTATTYTIEAQRRGSMASDNCGTLQLTDSGAQSVTGNSGGQTVTTCWRK